jgi:regulator of cell morphogenesis and NO signaling
MTITPSTLVADIVSSSPATIKVFQRHRIDFCCGGKVPLADVCEKRGLDAQALVGELNEALLRSDERTDWTQARLTDLVAHIQRRFHGPLTAELPRLRAMLDKVVSKHGEHLPDTLVPLQATFVALQQELTEHMAKEDAVLFPAILDIENAEGPNPAWEWIAAPIGVMEREHLSAGAALARIAELTNDYKAPDWACPTFRGLYYGLAELERDMHEHVHLENHILFPRAAALASGPRRVQNHPAGA